MINQERTEIHSCVCVRYCKEIQLKAKNNQNGNGVTRNRPDCRRLYDEQLFRCDCVEI